jgi:hypothetical protein
LLSTASSHLKAQLILGLRGFTRELTARQGIRGPITRKTTTSAATDSDHSKLAVGADIPASFRRIILNESCIARPGTPPSKAGEVRKFTVRYKGVPIGRVLRELVGVANCSGPTLASLGGNFGLWPLLGKTLAIVSDARLSGRGDTAVVVERLLSVSGEAKAAFAPCANTPL